jgi:hypothetical protein
MVRVVHHCIIGEAKDVETEVRQHIFSFGVFIFLLPMNWAFNLDHQFCFVTIKVNNESINNMLI